MTEIESKEQNSNLNLVMYFAVFVLFVVGSELFPYSIRTGGMSSLCGSLVRNLRTAVDMYADDHNGQYPQNLQAVVPNYLKSIPECCGTFDGCRARTVLGIRNFIAWCKQPKVGPPAVPNYRSYIDSQGNPQYEIICRRTHNGQKRFYSKGNRFETIRDGKVESY